MAKGAYSIITYPESSDIDKVVEKLVGAGAACKWILHDRFSEWELQQPTVHKPHYHIICGWETGFPTWKLFKALCDEVGAVALSPAKCVVRDTDGVEDYLTHKKYPEKFQFSDDDVQQTNDFAAELYQKEDDAREKRRQAKKEAKRSDVAALFQLVMESKLDEWCLVTDWVLKEHPESFGVLFENAFPIKAYLDSMRGSRARLNQQAETINALNETIDGLRSAYDKLSAENKELSADNLRLREMLQYNAENACGGDTAPAVWEI